MSIRLIALSVSAALIVGSFAGATALALSITADEPVVGTSAPQSASAPGSHALICGGIGLGKLRPGSTVRISVRLGRNRAVLEGVAAKSGEGVFVPRLLRARVVLGDSGQATRTFRIRRLAGTPGPGVLLAPGISPRHRAAVLCLARLAPHARPVAALRTTSDFNQCCTDLSLFGAPGSLTRHGGPAEFPELVVRNHRAVIRTVDSRFFGVFTDDADSALPAQFSTAYDGRLVNVTQSYLPAVRKDAAMWWREFVKPRNGPRDGLGALAAWVADEYVLRRGSEAWAKVERLERAGRLRGPAQTSQGAAYVRELRAFLVRTGYAP